MSWRRILLWTITSVLMLGVAVIVALLTIDLGFLKPQVERGITDAIGREFSIEGALSVRLGRRARVVAHDIRLQDAAWRGEDAMLRIARLEAEADLMSLVTAPVVIERIAVHDANVRLARSAANEANWTIGEPGTSEEDDGGDPGRREILLRQLDVSNVEVSLEQPERPVPFELHIARLRQDLGDDDVLSATLDATVNGRALEASGNLDSWSALLALGRIDYEVEARLDRVLLKGKGFIDSLAAPRRPGLEFSLTGPSVSDLYVMAGLGEHGVGGVDLAGSLAAREADAPLELRVAGNAGETRIDATGSVSDLQDLEHASLKLNANGPNLGRILGVFGILAVSEVPFTVSLDVERNGPELTVRESTLDIGDAKAWMQGRLPEFPSLGNATASARVEGPEIQRLKRLAPIPDGLRGPFRAEMSLDATTGGDEAYRAMLQTTLGELSAAGTLGPAPEHFGSRAGVRFAGDSLAAIAAAWGVEGPGAVPVALSGDAEYRADGIHLQNTVLNAGEHEAKVAGVIGTGAGLAGSQLALRLEGDNLADLGRAVYPIDGLPAERYRVDADVQIGDAGYQAREVSAVIGDTNVSGQALLSRRRNLAGSRASVSIEGPALERLVPALGTRRVRPGPFSFSASATIDENRLRLEEVRLQREFAALSADAEIGWPLSFEQATFAVRGEGRDVRALVGRIGPLHLAELPYALTVEGSRDGSHWQIGTLDAALGDARAHASGSIDYGESIASSRLDVSAQVPGLARLGTIDDSPILDRAVTLSARITGHDEELVADSLSLTIDEGTLAGNGRFRPGPVAEVHLDLRSDSLALHPLKQDDDTAETVTGQRGGRLIPDLPIDIDILRSLNGTLRATIGEFRRGNLRLRNVGVEATIGDGGLNVSRLGFEGKTGRLDANASVGPEDGTSRLALSVKARDFALGLDETNTKDFLVADIDARLSSAGNDLRAIAGNLDGFLLIDSRGGRVRNYRALQAIYGDLLNEMLSTINPFYKAGEYTNLDCVVIPIEIIDGRMQSAPSYLVLTDKIRVMSQATIELGTEAIDMNIRTLPRKSLGISAAEIVNPYVKIVGSLGAPRLALDQKGMLVAGGAAVATGGLSVLAKAAWDRFERASADGDPCQEAAAAAKVALAKYLE